MSVGIRLEMRQGQALVMTPQLLQAIKLLQLSTVELEAYVADQLERNPLLERADDAAPPDAASGVEASSRADDADRIRRGESEDGALATSGEAAFENSFGSAAGARDGLERPDAGAGEGLALTLPSWASLGGGGGLGGGESGEAPPLAEGEKGLRAHLLDQLAVLPAPAGVALAARGLVEALDDAGYLVEPLDELAARWGASVETMEAALALLQGCEPTGVGARDLKECLSLQLRERNRLDPCMALLVGRLDLVAKRDFAALRRVCGVDDEDLLDMMREIRALDPKPGLVFGGALAEPMIPDVFVRPAPDGSWHVELNPDGLPRVLVNQAYYARVSRTVRNGDGKHFLAECLQNANWLTRSLEQRARTILKVASEIVRQQDRFLVDGIDHLRPLNLRTVADAIGVHESTVSRVTSNKSIATPRGVFEMKYFFTAAIAATRGGEQHSAEAVRHRIRALIEDESPDDVHSDDTLVRLLREGGVDIARRTVAKYRESLRIPSSVERKREKQARLRVAAGA